MASTKLFWLGVTGVIVLGMVVFLILRSLPQEEVRTLVPTRSTLNDRKAPTPQAPPPSATRIKETEEFNGPFVQYEGEKFSPPKISLAPNEAGDGCLIKIKNSSNHTLVIRLSPHSPKDDQGFPYSPIPPGETSIIDPRYRLESIAFHNHEKPQEEFSVMLDEACRL